MISKNILVTGVSRGVGLEITRRLLDQGWSVFGVCRSQPEGLSSLQEMFPESLHVLKFDLSDLAGIRKHLFGESFVTLGTPLAGVVNNAAIAYDELITNFQPESLERMLRINVTAPMLICREAIRNMLLHQIPGALVHLSSVCAHTGYNGLSAYGGTKGALEAFSRGLAREWGRRGIRSNCISAGFMDTDMSAGLDQRQRAAIFRRVALRKATDPSSVAATVSFLLSAESASITGETLAVDSGSR